MLLKLSGLPERSMTGFFLSLFLSEVPEHWINYYGEFIRLTFYFRANKPPIWIIDIGKLEFINILAFNWEGILSTVRAIKLSKAFRIRKSSYVLTYVWLRIHLTSKMESIPWHRFVYRFLFIIELSKVLSIIRLFEFA